MSKQIVDLKELKDSRLLYEKDLPKFGYYIIIVVIIFLISVTAWSVKTPKNYIVKGSGTVVSDNKNYIMSEYAGEITEIYIKEGTYVEEGEFLFSIKSTELNLQEQQIEDQLSILNEKQELLERLENSIKDNTNYFREDVFAERPYYNQFEAYKSKLEQGNLDPSQYTKYGYEASDIENEVVKNEAKMGEIYYSTLQNTTEQIASIESEKEKLMVQQEAITQGKSEYQVMANASGIIHMLGGYKKGMVVQAGNALCSIANENDKYVIYSFVAAESRPLFKTGDKVDIAISGLPENLYGTIRGQVQYIESDITTNEGDKKSYFKISVEPDMEYLVSKAGNSVNVSNGMMVETRIIYDEVTYFRYMLEAIGILTRG